MYRYVMWVSGRVSWVGERVLSLAKSVFDACWDKIIHWYYNPPGLPIMGWGQLCFHPSFYLDARVGFFWGWGGMILGTEGVLQQRRGTIGGKVILHCEVLYKWVLLLVKLVPGCMGLGRKFVWGKTEQIYFNKLYRIRIWRAGKKGPDMTGSGTWLLNAIQYIALKNI